MVLSGYIPLVKKKNIGLEEHRHNCGTRNILCLHLGSGYTMIISFCMYVCISSALFLLQQQITPNIYVGYNNKSIVASYFHYMRTAGSQALPGSLRFSSTWLKIPGVFVSWTQTRKVAMIWGMLLHMVGFRISRMTEVNCASSCIKIWDSDTVYHLFKTLFLIYLIQLSPHA